MLVSVTERTREIGIAKALGRAAQFHPHAVPDRAMVIAVIGGIIGIGFGCCSVCWRHDDSVLSSAGNTVVGPWWVHRFSALVGMVFGILPARSAASLAPSTRCATSDRGVRRSGICLLETFARFAISQAPVLSTSLSGGYLELIFSITRGYRSGGGSLVVSQPPPSACTSWTAATISLTSRVTSAC